MLYWRVSLTMITLVVGACGPGTTSDVAPTEAPVSQFAEAEFASNTGGSLNSSPYFTRHDLGGGISIEIPNDWHVLDRKVVSSIVEQGAIGLDVAGISDNTPQTQNLIKANASQRDSGAILSVNVDVPPSISPSEFSGLTNADLISVASELRGGLEKALRAGGMTMTKFHGAHLDKFGPYPAIVIEYERTGILKPGDFIVQINQIAMGDKTVKLTMSYRIAEAFIWKARMARVRKSVVLNRL